MEKEGSQKKRPRGATPKGKLWDEEAGCWEDAQVVRAKLANQPPQKPRFKRPRGAAPKGKAWDFETGKWVDRADGEDEEDSRKRPPHRNSENQSSKTPYFTRPRGPAPAGTEWSYETGKWVPLREEDFKKYLSPAVHGDLGKAIGVHCKDNSKNTPSSSEKNGETEKREERTASYHTRPRGPAPEGKKWCYATGGWVNLSTDEKVKKGLQSGHIDCETVDALRRVEEEILQREQEYLVSGPEKLTGGNVLNGFPGLRKRFCTWVHATSGPLHFSESEQQESEERNMLDNHLFSRGNRFVHNV